MTKKTNVISRARNRDFRTWSENAAPAPKGKEKFGKKVYVAHWAMNLSFFRKSPYGYLIWHIVIDLLLIKMAVLAIFQTLWSQFKYPSVN